MLNFFNNTLYEFSRKELAFAALQIALLGEEKFGVSET